MTKVVCAGVCCTDVLVLPITRMPEPGGIVFPEHVLVTGGGSGHNTAIGLAALGHAVTICARVGRDPFADVLRRGLEAAMVDTAALRVDAHLPTSLSVVLVHAGGERSFIHHAGANASLGPQDVDDRLLSGRDWLHVGGAGVLHSLEGDALADLLARGHAAGLGTSVDTAAGPPSVMRALAAAMPEVDVCFVNEAEGAAICGRTEPHVVAETLVGMGAGAACVKMAGAGALLRDARGGSWLGPAREVVAVDATGAGDAFVAGFLSAWTCGRPPEDALAMGNAAGAECVRRLGATAWCGEPAALESIALPLR